VRRLRLAPTLLLLLAVLGLVATACGSSVAPPALTVNGVETSRQALLDQLQVMADNKDILLSASTPVYGPTDGSYDASFVASVLSGRVQSDLVAEEVARRGIQPTEADIKDVTDQLAASLSGATSSSGVTQQAMAEGRAKLATLGDYGTYLVTNVANLNALQNDFTSTVLTDDVMRAYYDQNIDTFTQACTSAIVLAAASGQPDPQTGATATPSEADYATALAKASDLERQLAAGADFATIATANSNDKTSAAKGGDLGCAAKGSYPQAIDDAIWSQTVGAVGQPVKASFGYVLLKVTSRGPLTFDAAKPQIQKALAQQVQSALRDWYFAAAKEANVTVDPQFGRWSAEQAQVLPPEGPSSPSTTSVLDQLGTDLSGSSTGSSVPTP